MNIEVIEIHSDLGHHPVYKKLTSIRNIRLFMKYHVFAVWDFMSLLKSLQKKITCVDLPWTESPYSPEAVRFINEIVLGEESDIGPSGQATSHFRLYLQGMEEVGADTQFIRNFLRELSF